MAEAPELSAEDRTAIQGVLLQWRAGGVNVPLLPMDVDVDGDGLNDAWGLDENDEVVFVPSTPLHFTVYKSDGDDVIEHEVE